MSADNIHHPAHYCQHPSGVEPIQIARHESFCIGSAMKYLFRYKHKGKPIEDLRKAIKHIEFEIERLENENTCTDNCTCGEQEGTI